LLSRIISNPRASRAFITFRFGTSLGNLVTQPLLQQKSR
jgi:hypothetical protein